VTAPAARAGPGGVMAGLAGTTVAHGLMLLAILASWRERAPAGTVYAVRLVAASPTTPDTRPRPTEAPPRPQERTAPIDPPRPAARPTPQPERTVPPPRREPVPQPRAATQPMPGETPRGGTDVANVSTPGAEFPFPDYLNNIVNEIYRRWQRPTSRVPLRVEVQFLILRDGTVRDIRVTTRSRDIRFDLGAQGAVEAAANARAFGPLPEGFQSDVLAISLWFTPREGP
jgi:outer membrane biosynthesis protein TonB